MNRVWGLRGSVALAVVVVGLAADAIAKPLQEELQGLLASHPDIRAREAAVASARSGVDRSYAGYLPRLDITGETGPAIAGSRRPAHRRGG